jgi:hypothetical protein
MALIGLFRELGWMTGFEPATSGATVRRSTAELHPPYRGEFARALNEPRAWRKPKSYHSAEKRGKCARRSARGLGVPDFGQLAVLYLDGGGVDAGGLPALGLVHQHVGALNQV